MVMFSPSTSARASGGNSSAPVRTSQMGDTLTVPCSVRGSYTYTGGTTVCATTTCNSLTSRPASGAALWCMASALQDATSTRPCSGRTPWSSLAARTACGATTMSSSSTWRRKSRHVPCPLTSRPCSNRRRLTRRRNVHAMCSLLQTTGSRRKESSATRTCCLRAAAGCTSLSARACRRGRPAWRTCRRNARSLRLWWQRQWRSTLAQRATLAKCLPAETRPRPSTRCSALWWLMMASPLWWTGPAVPAAARGPIRCRRGVLRAGVGSQWTLVTQSCGILCVTCTQSPPSLGGCLLISYIGSSWPQSALRCRGWQCSVRGRSRSGWGLTMCFRCCAPRRMMAPRHRQCRMLASIFSLRTTISARK
mmetsp:Transcript_142906/g.398166  ORF Transcript_142906/g.398166 Transcript_142906/m.398166 type:complete len:365 (+) Transcript_142906:605-1699(+)